MANEGLLYVNGWNAAIDVAIKKVQKAKVYPRGGTQEEINTVLNVQCMIIKDLEACKKEVKE